MVLVDADPVEAEVVRVLEQVEIVVVDLVPHDRIEEPRVDVDPDAAVLLTEVVRQVRPGHQVEPVELHGDPSTQLRTESTPLLSRPRAGNQAEVSAPRACFGKSTDMSMELPISSAITPSEISIGSFPPNAPFSQTIFKPTKTSTNASP